MTFVLRILLITVSLGTLVSVLRRIKKSKLSIEDSVFWIMLTALIFVFAVFPVIADRLSMIFGIYSTANFLFLSAIFILLIRLFSLSMKVSMLEEKLKELVQEEALRDLKEKDK